MFDKIPADAPVRLPDVTAAPLVLVELEYDPVTRLVQQDRQIQCRIDALMANPNSSSMAIAQLLAQQVNIAKCLAEYRYVKASKPAGEGPANPVININIDS